MSGPMLSFFIGNADTLKLPSLFHFRRPNYEKALTNQTVF